MITGKFMSLHTTMDRVGAAVSFICSIHCALAPVFITVAPLIGLGFIFEETTETILIMVSFGLAFLSLFWGLKKHQEFLPLFILLLGSVLISLARMDFTPENLLPEPLLMGLGGLSIATSHIINLRLCRSCHDCNSHEHN